MKGQTFTHDLTQLNYISGGNFRGKTARSSAIRLALWGYLPELGKDKKKTFELAGGRGMEVKLTFNDGSRVGRKWQLSGNSIKVSEELVDWVQQIPSVVLDPKEYFGLSGDKRSKYVFGLLNIDDGGKGEESVVAALKNISLGEANTEDTQSALQEVITLANGLSDGRSDAIDAGGTVTIQEWVDDLINAVKEKFAEANAAQKRMAGTSQGLTELAHASGADSLGSLPETERQIEALQKEIRALYTEQKDLGRGFETVERNKVRAEKLKKGLAKRNKPESIEEIKKRKSLLEHLVIQYASKTEACLESLNAVRRERDAVIKKIEEEESKIAKAAKDLAECCPTCGGKSDGWKHRVALESHRKSLQSAVEAAEKELSTSKDLDAKWNQDKASLEQAEATLRGHDESEEIFAQMQEELDGLNLEVSVKDKERISEIEQSITDKTKLVHRLQTDVKRIAASKADEVRKQQAESEYSKAMAEVKVCKEVIRVLLDIQARMVEKAFDTILEKANRVADGILKTPLAYREGEIGRIEDGAWIPHSVFSGTEQAVCYAAITVALALQSPFKLVIVDEMDRMDSENRDKFANKLRQMVDLGEVDQVILIGVNSHWDSPYNQITL